MMRADAAEIQLDEAHRARRVMRASDVEDAHELEHGEHHHAHSMEIELTTREGRVGELRLLFAAPVTFNADRDRLLARLRATRSPSRWRTR